MVKQLWSIYLAKTITTITHSVAGPSDPTHQWAVELPECSVDRVRVVYSNYAGGEDGMILGDTTFQEVRLQCTAPEGTTQVSMKNNNYINTIRADINYYS